MKIMYVGNGIFQYFYQITKLLLYFNDIHTIFLMLSNIQKFVWHEASVC